MPDRAVVAGRLSTLGHYLTAFVIFAKAISKLDHFHEHAGVILFFFMAALYILGVTLLHHRFHRIQSVLQASIYGVEAIVIGMVAWMYAEDGKRFLPYVLGFASVLFVFSGILALVRHDREKARHATGESAS